MLINSTDVKRIFLTFGFSVGVLGIAIASFFGVLDQMLPVFQGVYAESGLNEGFTIQLTFTALSSDIVFLVLPILCTLPFTSAFLDE